MINVYRFDSFVGDIYIRSDDGFITGISWRKLDGEKHKDAVIEKTYEQLLEYFSGNRKVFDVPVRMSGTPFQLSVWEELKKIPYGETVSYGEIAARIGCPKGFRAVGNSNNKNPVSIIVPCHRVVGANGSLTGYAGGLTVKEKLLELEKKFR